LSRRIWFTEEGVWDVHRVPFTRSS
jgi:hypothetical protein